MPSRDVDGHILRLNDYFALEFCSLLIIFTIMAPHQFLCGYCNHKPFSSKRAWTQHLKSSSRCAALMNSRYTSRDSLSLSHKHMPSAPVRGVYKGPKSVNKTQRKGRAGFKSVATSHLSGGKENACNNGVSGLLLDEDSDEYSDGPSSRVALPTKQTTNPWRMKALLLKPRSKTGMSMSPDQKVLPHLMRDRDMLLSCCHC